MVEQNLIPDLAGGAETLEQMLRRFRSLKPAKPHDRRAPPDAFVTSPRFPRGAGGAEAPLPKAKPRLDLCASR